MSKKNGAAMAAETPELTAASVGAEPNGKPTPPAHMLPSNVALELRSARIAFRAAMEEDSEDRALDDFLLAQARLAHSYHVAIRNT
jgi:hypothetical protein